jgi:CRISPR-associated endonuclease/helicase Cas3
LHNISNSVIIFDEAQNLPMEFLKPSLLAVSELVWNYGVTAVFCTATQPELARFFPSSVYIQEIIPNPKELYNRFQRIKVVNLGKQSDQIIVDRIQQHEQALCIVNTRKHALGLYKMLNSNGNYHLSTLMYPKHRKRIIDEIRLRLAEGSPCKVISTQLLEAGVDLDFPVGFRALAGLDSIIQAGGRVNRNRRQELAPLYVFEPESEFIKRNPGFVQQTSDVTRMVLREWEGKDPISTDAIQFYYNKLYRLQSDHAFDNKRILDHFEKQGVKDLEFDFRKASGDFSIIGDETVSVIVPIENEAIALLDQLRWSDFPRSIARKLQEYSVNIYRHEFNQLL